MSEFSYYALFYKTKGGWNYEFYDVGGKGTGKSLDEARKRARASLKDDLSRFATLKTEAPPPVERFELERKARLSPQIGEKWRVDPVSVDLLVYPRERLTAFRESLGLSQHEFSARLGAHRSAVCWWENGTRPITRLRALQICYEYGVRMEWLENGAGDMLMPKKRSAAERAKDDRMKRAVGFLLGCSDEFRDALYAALSEEYGEK